MLMDSGVGVSTKTTFMCHCGLVVKFNLVHWFRDWLTSPWWTGFWPRLVLRKGVKFSSLSFFYLPFDIWLGFSPCGKDWIHAMTVSFMKNTVIILAWTLPWKRLARKYWKSFPSSICTDFGLPIWFSLWSIKTILSGWLVHWSVGWYILPPWWDYFIPRVMPCFRMGNCCC